MKTKKKINENTACRGVLALKSSADPYETGAAFQNRPTPNAHTCM